MYERWRRIVTGLVTIYTAVVLLLNSVAANEPGNAGVPFSIVDGNIASLSKYWSMAPGRLIFCWIPAAVAPILFPVQ